jgi:hypothetical protein
MEYALLIYERPGAYDGLSQEERQALVGEYWALREDPRVVAGAGLKPVESATTVRVSGAETLVTDGPFADTQAGSPTTALRIVEGLDLDDYPYFHSTHAELLRRLGRVDDARVAYQRALELTRTEPERRFLQRRLEEL